MPKTTLEFDALGTLFTYIEDYEASSCDEVRELSEGLDDDLRSEIDNQCIFYEERQEDAFNAVNLELMPLVKPESRPALAKLVDILWENASLTDFQPTPESAREYILGGIEEVSYSSGSMRGEPLPGHLGKYGSGISWEGIERNERDTRSLRKRYSEVYD